MALFAALSIVLTRFAAFTIPLGGFPSLSLEFGGVPIVLGGIVLGPVAGGIIGFVSDIVGYMLNNRGGAYFFGFTLNNILTGVIPGIVVLLYKKDFIKTKVMQYINYFIFWLLALIGVVYAFVAPITELTTTLRVISAIVMVVIALLLSIIIAIVTKKYADQDKSTLNIIIMVVSLVEICVYIALTPIWISMLYQIPSIISVASRVFRALLMIPIKSIVIFVSLRAINQVIIKKGEKTDG